MSQFENYIEEVLTWNEDLKAFLHSEEIDRTEEIWERLDELAAVLEGIEHPESLNEEQLRKLHAQVEDLQQGMEGYYTKRQQLGTMHGSGTVIGAGKHQLPPLPYSFNALEPYISEEIMKLHYTKHHQAYVDGLNKAEKKLVEARQKGDFSLINHWSRELAFNGSGHYLHTIFWNNMSPKGGGKPTGRLLKEIENYFGSFAAFKKQFSEAAKGVEGVGWAILVWSPRTRRLEILQSELHMNLTQWDTIPLLVLDVWEHAYYLQYKNNRSDYVDNWWNLVNWQDVEARFKKASELKWQPY